MELELLVDSFVSKLGAGTVRLRFDHRAQILSVICKRSRSPDRLVLLVCRIDTHALPINSATGWPLLLGCP
jgi:hypothetical protein